MPWMCVFITLYRFSLDFLSKVTYKWKRNIKDSGVVITLSDFANRKGLKIFSEESKHLQSSFLVSGEKKALYVNPYLLLIHMYSLFMHPIWDPCAERRYLIKYVNEQNWKKKCCSQQKSNNFVLWTSSSLKSFHFNL